jgi:hypothetical protein
LALFCLLFICSGPKHSHWLAPLAAEVLRQATTEFKQRAAFAVISRGATVEALGGLLGRDPGTNPTRPLGIGGVGFGVMLRFVTPHQAKNQFLRALLRTQALMPFSFVDDVCDREREPVITATPSGADQNI